MKDVLFLVTRHPSPLFMHLITSEYPPQAGGVADYTRLVAGGLAAAGEEVHVWCPAADEEVDGADVGARGVTVHRELGRFAPADLRRVGRMLDAHAAPRRLLVQYVPHGYGYRSLNVAFCMWLWRRAALSGDRVEVMVHEPFSAFGEGSRRQDAAAVIHRLMATILLRASRRVWVSIPAWGRCWRPYALGRRVPFEWLPVPSTVEVAGDLGARAQLRARYGVGEDGLLVGHLGTYPRRVAADLERLLPSVSARDEAAAFLLLGPGGVELRARAAGGRDSLAPRLHATGRLPARELSAHLAACDLLVQPFPDGVSTRRTSVMAGLAHGVAVATTEGRLTEPLWAASRAVALAPAGDATALSETVARLLTDAPERARLADAGRALYRERFDLRHTVAALRRSSFELRVSSYELEDDSPQTHPVP
jgi:glycosyltransferase involved in cell wall biosynthesis